MLIVKLKTKKTKKVWDMCYQAQKHLSQGYSTMLIKSGDFQYSYRLWVEDNEGNDVSVEHNLPSYLPLSNSYYQDLVKKSKTGVKCYEIYSLYLGFVSVNMVARHDKKLSQLLTMNKKDKNYS
jgi:hypothetical protein